MALRCCTRTRAFVYIGRDRLGLRPLSKTSNVIEPGIPNHRPRVLECIQTRQCSGWYHSPGLKSPWSSTAQSRFKSPRGYHRNFWTLDHNHWRSSSQSLRGSSIRTLTSCGQADKEPILRLNVKQALAHDLDGPQANATVNVQGWIIKVHEKKKSKLMFIHLDDGSGPYWIQVVIDQNTAGITQEQLAALQRHTSISCTGKLVKSPGRLQSIELNCTNATIIGDCDHETYPFEHCGLRGDAYVSWYKRLNLHLRPRLREFGAVLRLRSDLMNALQIYMKTNDFHHVHVPIITCNDCEGGSKVFTVRGPKDGPTSSMSEEDKATQSNHSFYHYFAREAYLTVSGQLHLESVACALSRCYTIGPTFRAEISNSKRHLSEFIMFEAEEAFIERLDELLDRAESCIKFAMQYILMSSKGNLDAIFAQTEHKELLDRIVNRRFLRMTYSEVLDILIREYANQKSEESGDEEAYKLISHGQDLTAAHERFLMKYTKNVPLFITHWPDELKPFYMLRNEKNEVLGFDLIGPFGGEICGGSLRETSVDALDERLRKLNSYDSLKWYIDLRKYGNVPHGGFGIGFDRLVQMITGLDNIRDVVPFPRWSQHIYL